MSTVLFTVGLCGPDPKYQAAHASVPLADSGYVALMEMLRNFWSVRLPKTVKLVMQRWDKLTPEFIAGLPLGAGEKLVMVGHSLGAGFSVEVARALCGWNKIVHGLVGIDGVSPIWWGEGARPTRRFDGRGEQPLFKPFCGKWAGNTWDVVIPWNVEKVAWYYRGQVPTAAQPSNVTSGVWSFPIRGVETQIDVTTGPAALGRTPKILANKCYGTPAKGDPHGQWCWEMETISMAAAMAA